MHSWIPEIEMKQQAFFVGFFGPIGVSAVFYLYVTLEFLETLQADGKIRDDAQQLSKVMSIVIWFLAISSIVGLSLLV
jgi:sodium/hydrogen antiporter